MAKKRGRSRIQERVKETTAAIIDHNGCISKIGQRKKEWWKLVVKWWMSIRLKAQDLHYIMEKMAEKKKYIILKKCGRKSSKTKKSKVIS